MDKLIFRRQFLLSSKVIDDLSSWQVRILSNGSRLYCHPDVPLNSSTKDGVSLYLIGSIYDPYNPKFRNKDILEKILLSSSNLDDCLDNTKIYFGRYVLVYLSTNKFAVYHDALGLREVYYTTGSTETGIICGSQPNLIAQFSNKTISKDCNRQKKYFFEVERYKVRKGRFCIGNETAFTEIMHLLPNQYLDINSHEPVRYWPNTKLQYRKLENIAVVANSYLSGAIQALAVRHNLMMAVTAGVDSRTLLAVSRPLRNKIYYFINKESWHNGSEPDFIITSKIFKSISIPFHHHIVEQNVEDDYFRKTFFNNSFFAHEFMLPTVFNVYYKSHGDKINILGVGEIGRGYYQYEPRRVSAYNLMRSSGYKSSRYVYEQCQKWLEKVSPIAKKFNIDIRTLFLWEQLLGNWGSVGNSESDIAIEEIDPYNSHFLYEIFLSGNNRKNKNYGLDIFKKIIDISWPELLKYPFNPPINCRHRIKNKIKKTIFFRIFKKIGYFFGRIMFNFNKTPYI